MTDPALASSSSNGRVYRDNLPNCSLLTQLGYQHTPDADYPSVTAVLSGGVPKPALVPWASKLIAEYAVDSRERWAELDRDAAVDLIKRAADRQRDAAARRGTSVHSIVEKLAAGQVVPTIGDDLEPWIQSARQFVAEFRPAVIWSETTVFNRQFGYAGTLDLIADFPGYGRFVVDYKTSKAVYGDTGLQLAAYRHAEYGIHNDSRHLLPDGIQGGLVVHLTAGGYSVIPVECGTPQLDAFLNAMGVADHCRNARRLLGAPLRPVDHSGDDLALVKAWLHRRIETLITNHRAAGVDLLAAWPPGVPTIGKPAHTADELAQIEAVLDQVETAHGVPFGETKPAPAEAATSKSKRPGRGRKQEQAA